MPAYRASSEYSQVSYKFPFPKAQTGKWLLNSIQEIERLVRSLTHILRDQTLRQWPLTHPEAENLGAS